MKKIIWTPAYSVGISSLDEHHKHLAALINELADCLSSPANSEEVTTIVSALVGYANYHFEQEETLLAKHGFPEFEHHRGEHNQFCEVIAETGYGATLGIVNLPDLYNYLAKWWQTHILKEDMSYKPFFEARGVV